MNRQTFLAIIALLSFSSCFEIVEEIDIKADGSGTYEYTVNLSKSRSKLDGIMVMDSVNGYPVPKKSEIDSRIAEFISIAKETKGITTVRKMVDHENYIYNFSLDFSNIDALNAVVKEIRNRNRTPLTDMPDVHFSYDIGKRTFIRNGNYPLKDQFGKMKTADRVVFDGATFISVFRSEKGINSFSNAKAEITPNRKAILLESSVLDLINEKKNIGNTIQLEP